MEEESTSTSECVSTWGNPQPGRLVLRSGGKNKIKTPRLRCTKQKKRKMAGEASGVVVGGRPAPLGKQKVLKLRPVLGAVLLRSWSWGSQKIHHIGGNDRFGAKTNNPGGLSVTEPQMDGLLLEGKKICYLKGTHTQNLVGCMDHLSCELPYSKHLRVPNNWTFGS